MFCLISFPEIGFIVWVAVLIFGCKAVFQNPFISRKEKMFWLVMVVVLNWIGLLCYYYTFYVKDKE